MGWIIWRPRLPRVGPIAGGLVLVGMLLFYGAWLRGDLEAQAPREETARAIARALVDAVTLPRPRRDGSPIYVAHCRLARGGCEARMQYAASLFVRAGFDHQVDPWLLAAIAFRETGVNPDAVGGVGEFGMMQLHPRSRHGAHARRLCDRAPRECSAIVVDAAARLLSVAIARCGSELEALGLYHSGTCRIDGYARQVLDRRDALRGGTRG